MASGISVVRFVEVTVLGIILLLIKKAKRERQFSAESAATKALQEMDGQFSHLAWVQNDRKSGGLGDFKYPWLSDLTKSISKSYGVFILDQFLQENPDEVYAAGWKPGEKSMKLDPKLAKNTFEQYEE